MTKSIFDFHRNTDTNSIAVVPSLNLSQNYTSSTSGTSFNTINTIYAIPYFVGANPKTISNIGLFLPSGSAGTYRFGIYNTLPPTNSAVSIYPQNLVGDYGTAAVAPGLISVSLSEILENGLYWFCVVPATAITATVSFRSTSLGYLLGEYSGISIASVGSGTELPATFPSGAILQNSSPHIWADVEV